VNLRSRLLSNLHSGSAFHPNGAFHIVATKETRSAMHQNQMHRLGGIQNPRDLERYFAIGIAEDGLTVLQYKCQSHASAPSDIRQSNAHTQFSKSRSRRIHVTTSSTPWRVFRDRKSTRLNSSHVSISYAVFCLKKKTK